MLLHKSREVMQPRYLRLEEGGPAEPTDDDDSVASQRRNHRGRVAPSWTPIGIQIRAMRGIERDELRRDIRSEIRRESG